MQRGSILSILVVGILIVIMISYYVINSSGIPIVSPKFEVGQNEKTYTNQNLGLEFKYSKDLKILEDSEEQFNKRGNGDYRKNFKGYVGYEPGKFLGGVVVLDRDNSYDQNPFTIWVFNNDTNLTIEQWYKNYWYYPFVWGDFTYEGKTKLAPNMEATVSGEVGKLGIIDYQPGQPKFIYIASHGKMYLFRIIGSEGDKILATFKLTN